MRLPALLWLELAVPLGTAAAAAVDIPYVFNENSHDVGMYGSEQLANISASSPELVGVPLISSPKNSEILLFPMRKTYKTVGEIQDEFEYKDYEMNKYREAILACDTAIQLDPRSADAWYPRALIHKKEAFAAIAKAGVLE